MRILELCFSVGRGGLELYAAQASCQLAALGHEVLCVGTVDSFFSQRCSARRMLTPRWHRAGQIRRYLWLRRAIGTFWPDVIHVHHRRDFPLAAIAQRLSNNPRPRLAYHRHSDQPKKTRKRFYHRFLYANVDCYIAITNQMGERARAILPLPPGRVAVLLHGIDTGPSQAMVDAAARRLPANGHALRIGCFARIDERKGQHVLVQAIALLAARGVDVQVFLFGVKQDPEYYRRLKEMIAAFGLEDRVYYLGFVADPQAYMACCDIVVHAASAEPFGLAVAEAMASGVAVVAANSGGVPEIICSDDVGLLYAPGDAGALALHLARLIREPEQRLRLARNGRAFVHRAFSVEAHYQRLEALLVGAPAG